MRLRVAVASFSIAALTLLCASSGIRPILAAPARSFGTHCQDFYESVYQQGQGTFKRWREDIPTAPTVCSRFAGELDNKATHKYSFNLEGKQWFWHDTGDHEVNSLEDVDLFLTMTHGGAASDHTVWAMWNNETYARSNAMRLGDEAVGLSIMANVSCHTLQFDDQTWTRWSPIFRGGLRMALGSHDMFFWRNEENNVGKVFAQYLNGGHTFKTAWSAAFSNTPQPQDPAIMVVTNSLWNCDFRRDAMSWDNFTQFTRVRDDQITNWCGWQWTDL